MVCGARILVETIAREESVIALNHLYLSVDIQYERKKSLVEDVGMILVTGATGQLGFDVVKELEKRAIACIGVGSSAFDLTNQEAVCSFFERVKPSAVIHCAAYTAVDSAETESERCTAVNVDGTSYLAQACKGTGAKMLYVSTDYVFSREGDSPFETTSTTSPLGVYGKTKREGELEVEKYVENYFILRISWVFGKNGNNFVKTMIKLGKERDSLSVVADQIGSPTYTVDLAKLICDMIETEQYGVYHASNEGYCSWADFAKAIMAQTGQSCEIIPIPTEEYPTPAKRPKNSRLSKKSLDLAGFSRLPSWEDGLARFCKEL